MILLEMSVCRLCGWGLGFIVKVLLAIWADVLLAARGRDESGRQRRGEVLRRCAPLDDGQLRVIPAAICELGKKWRSKRDPSSGQRLALCRDDNLNRSNFTAEATSKPRQVQD